MRTKVRGLFIGAFASTIIFGAVEKAQAVVTTDVDFAYSGSGNAGIGITFEGLAQTFTVGLDGTFHSASIPVIRTDSSVTTDLRIALWSTSSGSPASELAAVNIAASDVGIFSGSPVTYTTVTADFSSAAIAVNMGDVLAVAISSPGLSGGAYAWNGGVGNEYTGGQRYTDFSGGGVVWASVFPDTDFSLKTYVDTGDTHMESVPEPATLALLSAGLAGIGLSRRRRKTA